MLAELKLIERQLLAIKAQISPLDEGLFSSVSLAESETHWAIHLLEIKLAEQAKKQIPLELQAAPDSSVIITDGKSQGAGKDE